MKLSNKRNLILIFAVALLISNTLNLTIKNKQAAPQSPTENPADAGKLPLGKQPLSHALSEADPKRGMKLHEFVENIKFTTFQLTRGETEQLFEFADQDKDDIVNFKEWQIFTEAFIAPFEACDRDKDYLLSPEEFGKCFEQEPAARLVKFRNSFGNQKYSYLMESVTCRSKLAMNFAEYFLVRRGLFAWKTCQTTDKYISYSQFKCAIRTAIPPRYQIKVDLDEIYNIGLRLANEKGLVQLDYVSYQRIVYFTYIFSIIGTTHDKQYISREQFRKFIKEQRYPTFFTLEEVELLYKLINTNSFKVNENMSFATFCYFFNMHRLFNEYSKERPLQLNKKEFLALLDDFLTPQGIVYGIDLSHTNFNQSEYSQASIVLHRFNPGEQNYYYGFKQADPNAAQATPVKAISDPTDSVQSNHTFYDRPVKNVANREVFFTLMTGTDRNYWTKEIFYRAMELGNLFISLCHDKRWIVSTNEFVLKLNSAYDTVNPSINFSYRTNYVIYRSLPKDLYLDIINFMELENFKIKINYYADSTPNGVIEPSLKIILQDYGMGELTDTVLALSLIGADSQGHKIFDSTKLVKDLVVATSIAGSRRREAALAKDNKIKQLRYHGSVLA